MKSGLSFLLTIKFSVFCFFFSRVTKKAAKFRAVLSTRDNFPMRYVIIILSYTFPSRETYN